MTRTASREEVIKLKTCDIGDKPKLALNRTRQVGHCPESGRRNSKNKMLPSSNFKVMESIQCIYIKHMGLATSELTITELTSMLLEALLIRIVKS